MAKIVERSLLSVLVAALLSDAIHSQSDQWELNPFASERFVAAVQATRPSFSTGNHGANPPEEQVAEEMLDVANVQAEAAKKSAEKTAKDAKADLNGANPPEADVKSAEAQIDAIEAESDAQESVVDEKVAKSLEGGPEKKVVKMLGEKLAENGEKDVQRAQAAEQAASRNDESH